MKGRWVPVRRLTKESCEGLLGVSPDCLEDNTEFCDDWGDFWLIEPSRNSHEQSPEDDVPREHSWIWFIDVASGILSQSSVAYPVKLLHNATWDDVGHGKDVIGLALVGDTQHYEL